VRRLWNGLAHPGPAGAAVWLFFAFAVNTITLVWDVDHARWALAALSGACLLLIATAMVNL
jgi:hypothetical protein